MNIYNLTPELLGNVLKINDINLILYDKDFPNEINYTRYANFTRGSRDETINIYELAHKCKEWAFWNDYKILIKMTIPDIYRSEHKINYTFEIYHTDGTLKDVYSWFDTEPEAIFKACQWIYDNKEK